MQRFGAEGLPSLFTDKAKIPQVLMTILAFSLSDTFDTIGTFIGTGRRTGIFSQEDEEAPEDSKGLNSKMDRALFADAIATSIGAVLERLIRLLSWKVRRVLVRWTYRSNICCGSHSIFIK